MPFERPTLTDLIDRVSTDIASRLPGKSTTLLRRSLAGILARSEAGAVHSLYGYLDFISRQALPDTAEEEYLLRWSRIWLPKGRKAATYATGNNAVQVRGVLGSRVEIGTVFVRSDRLRFRATSEAVIGSTTAVVSVEALTPGASSNTAPGVSLSLLQPVTGIESDALVVSPGIIGGVDQETIEQLRIRVINRIQQPPQGGSKSDYETWALEVPGVTRAWVYPMQMGAGTVTVVVANDNGLTAPIPDAAIVTAAQSYINEKRPVTATVYVVAPTTLAVNMAIKLAPNTSATQSAAQAEIDDLFLRDAEPGGTMLISKMREAVSVASGVEDSEITTPTANVVAGTNQIPVVGTITWSAV